METLFSIIEILSLCLLLPSYIFFQLKPGDAEKVYHYYKKKWHIIVDCYVLKNRSKAAGATDKEKQLENTAKVDAVKDGQCK